MRPPAALVLASSLVVPPASAECLRSNVRVSPTGTVAARTFRGPPDFESAAKVDAPETVPILTLAGPVCVAADPSQPDVNPAIPSVPAVQLVARLRGLGVRSGPKSR